MVARPYAWARTVCIAVVLLAAGLAGCLSEVEDRLGGSEEAPEPRVTVEAVSSWNSDADLLAFTLEEGATDGHPLGEVTVQATTDAGERAELDGTSLCRTPALADGGCERAVEPPHQWTPGETLYAPCPGSAASVQVTVEGTLAAGVASGLDCPVSSSDGGTDQDQTGDGDSTDSGPEQASAVASGVDLNDDGDVEWIQLTLTKGENAPYDAADVTNSTVDPSGNQLGYLCEDASDATCDQTDTAFRAADGDTWDVGQTLWVPCQAAGNHQITLSVSGTAILDQTVTCDEAA